MSRRISPLIVVLVLLLTPLILGFAPPRQSDSPITLQLEAGFGRRFRPDTWTPLLIAVANDGPDISGVLRVRADGTAALDGTTYSTPIDLPQQSRKQVFLYVSLRSFGRQVQVELVDVQGSVIASTSSQLNLAAPQDVLAAVITDAPGGSVDLTGAVLGSGQTYQHNWAIEDIPPEPEALMALDVMVFTDVDTGRLSLAQVQAVTDWVLSGGHLIVTGGPNYRLTGAGLADLLPLTVSGSTTVDDLSALAAFTGQRGTRLAEPDIVLATGVPRPQAEVLARAGQEPLLVRQRRGGGVVDYLAADPALAPFRQWTGRAGLWDALIFAPHQQPSWTEGIQDWLMAERVIQQSPGFALPSAFAMFGMLIVYILVIGPVNYLALRLIGRRELAWFTIPLIVIIFSVLAYFTGFSLRGTQATLNRMTVVQVWPGEDRARVDGLVGVLSPRRSTYTLAAHDGLTLRPLPESNAGGGFAPMLSTVAITQGSGFAAEEVLIDSSVIAAFASSGFIEGAPHLEGAARIIPDSSGTHVSGQVTNATGFELEDAAVLINGGVQHLGTLAPGASAVFDLRLVVQQSAPLSLVAGDDAGFVYENIELTAQDVLGLNYSPTRYYAPSSDPEARLQRQRQNLVSALAYDRDVSGGRGDRVFLFGWAKTSPLGMSLEGAPWGPEDMTLYIFELPVMHETPTTPITIMAGMVTWAVSPEGGLLNANPYDLTLNGTETAGFRFTPLPGAQLGEVTRLDIVARRTSPNTATVMLKNWQTGQWEPLALESGVRGTIEDTAPYLGPNQAVELLLIPDDVNYYVSYAEIGVRWHGTF
ncbi:MAG: hypothetical protein JXN59_10860 [Anaerolineae bacterium]|nr:hypothetical protein [Anaerolineae bacterium]